MGTWSLIVVLLISSTASLEKDCPSNILKKFLSDSSKTKAHYQNGETISVTCLADSDDFEYDYKYDGADTKDNSVVLNCTDGKWIGHYPECFKNCSRPEIFATLDPEHDEYFPGDIVTVTKCKKDNIPIVGDASYTCMADGTWTGSARCPKPLKSCNEQPPTIANAYIAAVVLDEYNHGTVLRYKCGQAYDQTGRHSVTCQDGRWIQDSPNLMQCNTGQCSPIYNREIDNGRVKNIIGEVGTYAEFECYNGYELEGSERILCMADRKWYPEIPRCNPVSCPSLKQPSHGRLAQEAFNGVLNIYQSTIRYDCDKGYRLVGPQFRKCQADRTWSGNDTKCEEIVCEKPSSPENGEVYLTDNAEKVGSQIEYICHEHYTMEPSTSQFAICNEHGYWSRPRPHCIKSCMVSPPSNGLLRKGGWRGEILTKVTYVPVYTQLIFSCANRFEMYAGGYVRDGRLTCENGLLLPGVPECRPRRCRIDMPANPEYFIGENKVLKGFIDSGTLMQARCPNWMELVSLDEYLNSEMASVKCNAGALEPQSLGCKDKRCKIPKVENGKFKSGGIEIGTGEMIDSHSINRLICDDGYELYNERTHIYLDLEDRDVHCYQGSFKADIPTCKPKRCKMETDSRLLPEMLTYSENGVNLTVSCTDKMELFRTGNYLNENETMVSCNKGTWIPGLPRCIKKRCILPTIGNILVRKGAAMFRAGEKFDSGEKAQLECSEGFELYIDTYIDSNRTSIECNEGSFIGNLPSCKEKRCQMDRSSNLLPQIGFTESGSSLNISCPDNMELRQYGVSEYGEHDRNGESVNKQIVSVVCSKGTWTPDLPHCGLKMCKTIGLARDITGFIVSDTKTKPGEFVPHNQSIETVCSEGYRQQGVLTCNAGIWMGNSTCELEVCDTPAFLYTIVNHGIGGNGHRGFSHGTKLNVSCNSSSSPYPNDSRWRKTDTTIATECIRGKWKPEVSCKNLTGCILKDAGMHFISFGNGTVVSGGQVEVGENVKVSCKFGYKIVLSAKHESTYEYDYPDAESTADPLEMPETKDNEKLILVSDGNYTCGDNGKWEPEIRFACKQIICDSFEDYNLENGKISYSSHYVYTVGTVASFTCNPGYKRHGPETRTCQTDGTWSGVCVTCQSNTLNSSITCPAPCVPVGARKIGSHTYEIGSIIEFHCSGSNTQHRVDSSKVWHCINNSKTASWNGTQINCKEVICDNGDHYNFENGKVIYSSSVSTVGTVASFRCNSGYTRDGPETRKCQKNGVWSGECVTCQNNHHNSSTCPAPCVPDGAIKIGSHTYKLGSSIQFRCLRSNMQYISDSSYIRHCVNNSKSASWNGTEINCKAECSPLTDEYNVVQIGVVPGILSDKTVVEVNCSKPLSQFNDITKAECKKGIWRPRKPTCEYMCSLPSVIGTLYSYNNTRAQVFRGLISSGRRIKVACEDGFVLNQQSSDVSICVNGVWEPEIVRCEKTVSCASPNIPNAIVDPLKEMYTVNESVSLKGCNERLFLVGARSLVCLNDGSWSGHAQCTSQIFCNSFDDYSFENGKITYSTSNVITEGTVAFFTCHPGYRRDGQENRTCQVDGTWSGECVTCQSDEYNSSTTCSAPCVPDGVRKTRSHTYEIGSRVEFHCLPSNTQYSGDSSNIRHCIHNGVSASWNGSKIDCIGIRDVLLTKIAELVTDGSKNLSLALGLRSDEIIVAANEPAMNASLKILQYWRDNAMKGKPRSLIPQLIIALEKLQKRHEAEGLRILYDLQNVRCMQPVLNGTVKPIKSYYQFGESVTVSSCNDGYMLENESYLVCSEYGTWLGNSTCRYAICIPTCGENKRCVRDNECQCAEGFFGKACDPAILPEGECEALTDRYTVIQTSVVLGRRSYKVAIQCNVSEAPFDDISEAECKNGKWIPWKPICQNTCALHPVPGTHYNYNISKDPVLPGLISSNRKIRVSCESGYILRLGGSDVSQCENGIWQPDISACEKIVSCTTPNISDIIFQPSKEMYAVNETVSLTGCQRGLELVGAKILSCGRDGSWSGHAQCLSYCNNGVAHWKERSLIQYTGNAFPNPAWLKSRFECLEKCEAQAECRAVHVIDWDRHVYCTLLRENTKSNRTELFTDMRGVIIERVCIDVCVVSKDLDEISLHNGHSPYDGEKVQDGMVLSIKCKDPGLTAVPGHVTCMGGKWSHPIEEISCLSKGTNV